MFELCHGSSKTTLDAEHTSAPTGGTLPKIALI